MGDEAAAKIDTGTQEAPGGQSITGLPADAATSGGRPGTPPGCHDAQRSMKVTPGVGLVLDTAPARHLVFI
jgi:hypothetical protein